MVFIITSCSNSKQIEKFENILGSTNSKIISNAVIDFENQILKNQYPGLSLEQAYRKYLNDVEDNYNGDWKRISKRSKSEFDKNNFKYDFLRIADSVWIEQNNERKSVQTKWKYLNTNGEFKYGFSESSLSKDELKNADSLIANREGYYDINLKGNYRKAFESISEENNFIAEYLEMTNNVGKLDPRFLAYKILESNVELNNYFIKRLIITDIAY